MQKPASLTIREGRIMADHVKASGRVLQVGSQQRSWKQFAPRGCELVRNGRIGAVQKVEVGFPGDPPGGNPSRCPFPPGSITMRGWVPRPRCPTRFDRVMPLN